MNARIGSLALALAAALSFAMPARPARASDPQPASHAEGGAQAEKAPEILTGDLGNVFWTSTIFIVLLIVLRLTAWKPILTALRNREKFIADSLAQAARDRDEAKRTLAEYTARVEKARHEASEIVEEGRRDAEETRKRIHTEARAEADAMIARARRDLEIARDDAVKQIYDQAIGLATVAAGKMIGRELKADDHKRLLDESLSELSKLGT